MSTRRPNFIEAEFLRRPQRPAGLKDDASTMRVLDLERGRQGGARTKRRCVALTRAA